jgi:5-methylcytosine-specific restriction endonuclease McrA
MAMVPSRRADGKANPEYSRWYWAQHHDEILARQRAYQRAHRRTSRRVYYRPLVVALLVQRDGQLCGLCGLYMPEDDRTIDHVLQVAAGGSDAAENLRLTHAACNGARPKLRATSTGA